VPGRSHPELVSTPELAKALGLSLRSVQRYIAAGKIVPDLTTPGGPGGRGQHRWNIERVREQLRGVAREQRDG
jgi:hypothetical protein